MAAIRVRPLVRTLVHVHARIRRSYPALCPYSRSLAQWQLRIHRIFDQTEPDADLKAILEMTPRVYDPQKATRITLFHALLHYTLGRIWIAANAGDAEFAALINPLGVALGKSRYLDGHQTDWGQQFLAMLWERGGGTVLE